MAGIYSVAVYEADPDEGGYWCEVLNLPGCVAQGETIDELRRNLLDAIAAWEETEREEAAETGHEHFTWRKCETWNFAMDDEDGLVGAGSNFATV